VVCSFELLLTYSSLNHNKDKLNQYVVNYMKIINRAVLRHSFFINNFKGLNYC